MYIVCSKPALPRTESCKEPDKISASLQKIYIFFDSSDDRLLYLASVGPTLSLFVGSTHFAILSTFKQIVRKL
jgi:hypothetical protein